MYCARSITKGFHNASYIRTSDWEEKLQAFVANLIYRSHLGVGVTVAALTLAQRYQKAKTDIYTPVLDDARRVFLISYMIATKVMQDDEFTLLSWKRVIEREYDCSDLAKMEVMFYETVDWEVQIDEEEFHRCFQQTFDWYQNFIDEHTLPASPLPTYQPFREPLPANHIRSELNDDEARISRAMGLPLPCTTAVVQQKPWSFSKVFSGFRRQTLRNF